QHIIGLGEFAIGRGIDIQQPQRAMGEFTPRSNTSTDEQRRAAVENVEQSLNWLLLAAITLLTPLLSGCAPASTTAIRHANPTTRAVTPLSLHEPQLNARQGRLRLLTYIVAGLPAIVSASDPDENTRKVSPLLNGYDIVLAQEDFSYHDDLVE